MAELRATQREILKYRSGRMGIAAVPGSGKTWTLSRLAADLLPRTRLQDDQEILIVTLVNSAVDNFYRRVGEFVQRRGLLPNLGYRVCTLHSLASDIVRQRPTQVGLSDGFTILDEHEAEGIRADIARAWLAGHPNGLDPWIDPHLDDYYRGRVQYNDLPRLVESIALSFIRTAKDNQLSPDQLRLRLDRLNVPLPLAEMGCNLYAHYEHALHYRGAVDFDDLIRLALQALEQEPDFLEALQHRWPYILEDEAQDSSLLQQKILSLLAGPRGNWVRVGDPNQAIYETFTTASPKYLLDFIDASGVIRNELPHSGRSTTSIIALANELVRWTQAEHPVDQVRDALKGPPYIRPTDPGDPQPNPLDDPSQVRLVLAKFTPEQEIERVADSLCRWLPEHPDATVAVLVPRHKRGYELVDGLRGRNIEVVDSLLRASQSTRSSAGVIANLLAYLSDPKSAPKLAMAHKVWRRAGLTQADARQRQEKVAGLLRKLTQVEDYIWPEPDRDWLASSGLLASDPDLHSELEAFRERVCRWQGAILLPVDQIALTLAQDLMTDPVELAVAHKLAVNLRRASLSNPTWRLPELTDELAAIARNERRFIGFDEADTGFNPDAYKGKVVIATMHKAKGLEWDRVYLMSVNNYDFPSALPGDTYISERWFLRESLNLEAEALAQLKTAIDPNAGDSWLDEGQPTLNARLDYVRERLRLLYVGITRAKKELVITWNTGRKGEARPAASLAALEAWWRENNHTST